MPHVYPTQIAKVISLMALVIMCLRAEAQTLTDDQLIELGVSSYESGEFEDALRYLYAYRQRRPMPAILQSDPAFLTQLETAIAATINLLKARAAENQRLKEQVLELGGAITTGIIYRPPLPMPPIPEAETNDLDEDCTSFQPESLNVAPVRGGWVLGGGSHSIKVFRREDDAKTALRIIRHHGWNQHCVVGRPTLSMEYFAPAGRSSKIRFSSDAAPKVFNRARHP